MRCDGWTCSFLEDDGGGRCSIAEGCSVAEGRSVRRSSQSRGGGGVVAVGERSRCNCSRCSVSEMSRCSSVGEGRSCQGVVVPGDDLAASGCDDRRRDRGDRRCSRDQRSRRDYASRCGGEEGEDTLKRKINIYFCFAIRLNKKNEKNWKTKKN